MKCFSYPLTELNTELSLTANEVHENFLDPMKDNIEYQAKKPGAVTYEMCEPIFVNFSWHFF